MKVEGKPKGPTPTGGGTGLSTPPNVGSGESREPPMKEIMALAEIRAVTGLGSKPMLSELAIEIGKILAAKDAKIARLTHHHLTDAEFRALYENKPTPKFRPKICWYCYIDGDKAGAERYFIRGFLLANRTGFPDKISSEICFQKSGFDNDSLVKQERAFLWAIKSIEGRLYRLIDEYSEVAAP